MTQCDWFEKQGLKLLEEGKSLEHHLSDCEHCREQAKAYENLTNLIGSLDQEVSLPENFKGQLLDQVANSHKSARKVWPWIASASAAAVLALFTLPMFSPSIDPSIRHRLEESTNGDYRSSTASIGDTVNFEITDARRSQHYEFRLYFEDRAVVFRCSGPPQCDHSNKYGVSARYQFTAPGSYRALVILGNQPPPDIVQNIDSDARYYTEKGFHVLIDNPININ